MDRDLTLPRLITRPLRASSCPTSSAISCRNSSNWANKPMSISKQGDVQLKANNSCLLKLIHQPIDGDIEQWCDGKHHCWTPRKIGNHAVHLPLLEQKAIRCYHPGCHKLARCTESRKSRKGVGNGLLNAAVFLKSCCKVKIWLRVEWPGLKPRWVCCIILTS